MRDLLSFVFLCVVACSGQMEGERSSTASPANHGEAGNDGASVGGAGADSASAATVGGYAGQTGESTELTADQHEMLEDRACNGWSVENEPFVPSVSIVLDVSQSMHIAPPSGVLNAWMQARLGIAGAVGSGATSAFPPGTSVELWTFPSLDAMTGSASPNNTCVAQKPVVPFGVLDTTVGSQASAITAALETAQALERSPIADAYNVSVQSFLSASRFDRATHYVLLVTDGFASLDSSCAEPCPSTSGCKHWWADTANDSIYSDPSPILSAIESTARNYGIRTLVVQAGRVEPTPEWLSEAAVLGQTPRTGCDPSEYNCHLNLNVGTLGEQLRELWPKPNRSCVFLIPETSIHGTEIVDPGLIAPVLVMSGGGMVLLKPDTSTLATCEDGFRVIAEKQLQLCSTPCEMFNDASSPAGLQLFFGCASGGPKIPLQ